MFNQLGHGHQLLDSAANQLVLTTSQTGDGLRSGIPLTTRSDVEGQGLESGPSTSVVQDLKANGNLGVGGHVIGADNIDCLNHVGISGSLNGAHNNSGGARSNFLSLINDLDIDVGQNAVIVGLHEDHIVLVIGDLVDGAGNQLAVNVNEVDLNVLGIRIGRAAELDDVVLDGVGAIAVSHLTTGDHIIAGNSRIGGRIVTIDQDTLAVVGRTIDQSVLGERALGLDGGSGGVTVDEAVILIEVTQSIGVGTTSVIRSTSVAAVALDVDDVLVVAGNGDIRSGIVEDEPPR